MRKTVRAHKGATGLLPTARVKRWGGSLAIVISADFAKERGVSEGQDVTYDIRRKGWSLSEMAGMFEEELKDLDPEWVKKELAILRRD